MCLMIEQQNCTQCLKSNKITYFCGLCRTDINRGCAKRKVIVSLKPQD